MAALYTKHRAKGWTSDPNQTGVHACHINAFGGSYEVWIKGVKVADCTDKYMADAVWSAIETRRTAPNASTGSNPVASNGSPHPR